MGREWSAGDLVRHDGIIKKVSHVFDFNFDMLDGSQCHAILLMFSDGTRGYEEDSEYVTENELYLEELRACQDGRQTGSTTDVK